MDARYKEWLETDGEYLGETFLNHLFQNEHKEAIEYVSWEMECCSSPTVAKSTVNGSCRLAIHLNLYDIVELLIQVPEWIDRFYLDEMSCDERTLKLLLQHEIIDKDEFLRYIQKMRINNLRSWEQPDYNLERVREKFNSLDDYFIVPDEIKEEITLLLREYYPYFLGERSRTPPPPEEIEDDGCIWCGHLRSCACQEWPESILLDSLEELLDSLEPRPSFK